MELRCIKTTVRPQYGRPRRTKIRRVLIDIRMGGEEIEEDFGESVYMFDRNQLACQHPSFGCGRTQDFATGGPKSR